jgi:hypothetical protein
MLRPLSPHEFFTDFNRALPTYEANDLVESYSTATAKKAKRVALLLSLCESEKDKLAQHLIKKEIITLQKFLTPIREELISECYRLYLNAYEAELPFVLGSDLLHHRDIDHLVQNFGIVYDKESSLPKRLLDLAPNGNKGAVIASKSWSTIKNDATLLGVTHSRKTCYIAGDLDETKFWDPTRSRPKMISRELTLLYNSGYKQVAPARDASSFGYTFVPLSKEDPKATSIDSHVSRFCRKLKSMTSTTEHMKRCLETV